MSKELKILINNEEVVCDKQISIDEKMLSTSSTILKNCYPKFWETDKDYVSRFYFPKDYSKCRISYDEFHPEEQGEIVTGTNLSINYDSTKNFELLQLQGNTYQQTYTGKNLLNPVPDVSSINGVTVSYNSATQEITLNGTCTTNNSVVAFGESSSSSIYRDNTFTLPANTRLYIKIQYVSGTSEGSYRLAVFNNSFGTGLQAESTQSGVNVGRDDQWTTSVTFTKFRLRFENGTKFNNYKVKLLMSTSGYDYEPYVGRTASPNPDYPQPINNVTGRQVIDVVGKNLFDKSVTPSSQNGTTTTELDTGIRAKVTATGQNKYTAINLKNSSNLLGKTLTISATITPSGTNNALIRVYWLNGNTLTGLISNTISTTGSYTFTIPSSFPTNKNGIALVFSSNASSGTSQVGDYVDYTNVQLEIGSTATTYEPYIGQSYELNLGKNLFDKDNANILNAYFNLQQGIVSNNDTRSIYIKCQPNTTYTIQKSGSVRFRIGTTSSVPSIGTSILNINSDDTASVLTITTPSNAQYLIAYIYGGFDTNPKTFDEVLETVQIEQGSTASSYSSYFTPIELNKIGNYQDRIYKENGTWYIEKKIGKVVFDGSTNAFGYSSSNSVFVTDTLSTLIKKNTTMIANYYNQVDNTTTYANMTTGQMKLDGTNSGRIIIKDTRYTSANDYKIWLQSNNLILYYVLNTPTYTEITNTDLINKLESITLLNGINNINVTSPDLPGALNIHYNFKEAYTESDLVFCGVVKNTGNISLNPREPHFVDLQILDFKTLLSEGETLNYVITDKTIPEAIEQVVASISDYGFVTGNINILNPNDKINAYSTLNKTAYDVFQYIADVTQSKWATRVIDEDTIAIDFYDPTLMPQASPIEYNQTYFENNDIENMTFNYSTNDYRNKQIMTSDEVFGNIEQIETIICNGYQDTYTCQNKIGIIKKITVNDVECTFATKNEVELGVTADFIYQPGEIVFTSSQIYTSGSVIVITYLPIVKGREIVLNNEESSRISSQINRKGTISRYENRNDTTSGQELIKIGQSYIKYKGSAEITLKIVSSKNLFNVGQIVEFNAPLEELSTEYMVKNKTIDIWTIDSNETQVFYTYELSSNFNSENAINYFDNQRAKNQGNIGEGETIVRNIDIENTALIQFYETNIEEVEISNISTLDFSLDAVLI